MCSEWNVINYKTRVQSQYHAKLVRVPTQMKAQVIKRCLSTFALKRLLRLLFIAKNQVLILLCSIYVWVFPPLVPNPIFYVSFSYLPKIAYIRNESTWSSFGFSKYNLCWQRKNKRCNLLQKSLNYTGFSLRWCSHTSGLKICQSRPSQYLSNIESAFGVCLS